MQLTKIAIGSEHAQAFYKHTIVKKFKKFQWIDLGVGVDHFPLFSSSEQVIQAVQSGQIARAVFLSITGAGMAIAANRYSSIYAVVAWNSEVAKRAKEQHNANILIIPTQFVSLEMACESVTAWIEASFLEGKTQQKKETLDRSL